MDGYLNIDGISWKDFREEMIKDFDQKPKGQHREYVIPTPEDEIYIWPPSGGFLILSNDGTWSYDSA